MMSEHGVDDAGRKRVLANIPIHQHATVEFGDLSVQRNLRSLRDDPARRTKRFGDVVAEQLAESERAGEHDRRQHWGAAVAAQVAKYRQARVIECAAAVRMASCTAPARDAASLTPDRSMSSSSDEVKSPTRLSTSGWKASRPNSGRLSRNREVPDQHASVWAKAAANIIAGVTPCDRALLNSASRVAGQTTAIVECCCGRMLSGASTATWVGPAIRECAAPTSPGRRPRPAAARLPFERSRDGIPGSCSAIPEAARRRYSFAKSAIKVRQLIASAGLHVQVNVQARASAGQQ